MLFGPIKRLIENKLRQISAALENDHTTLIFSPLVSPFYLPKVPLPIGFEEDLLDVNE